MKIIPTLAPAEKFWPVLEITNPLYSFSAKSIALCIPWITPPPIVFIFVWNSKLMIPSPKSTIVVSPFVQIVFSARSASKRTKFSVPGIVTNDLLAIS